MRRRHCIGRNAGWHDMRRGRLAINTSTYHYVRQKLSKGGEKVRRHGAGEERGTKRKEDTTATTPQQPQYQA